MAPPTSWLSRASRDLSGQRSAVKQSLAAHADQVSQQGHRDGQARVLEGGGLR